MKLKINDTDLSQSMLLWSKHLDLCIAKYLSSSKKLGITIKTNRFFCLISANKLTNALFIAERLDLDCKPLVDGVEGAGKSIFTFQCAYFLDPKFTIDRVCFNATEFFGEPSPKIRTNRIIIKR